MNILWPLWLVVTADFFQVSLATGVIETKFVSYEHSCDENWNTNPYDPMFTFCWSRPRYSFSVSKSQCHYGKKGESSSINNDKHIVFQSKIGGISNPWLTTVDKFFEPTIMLSTLVRNHNSFTSHDTMGKLKIQISPTVYPTLNEAKPESYTITASSCDSKLKFTVKVYCHENYYTSSCDKYCKAENSSKGHYFCEAGTGNKICLTGWTGVDCDEDVNECLTDNFCGKGECKNTIGGFQCYCIQHYYGLRCQHLVDPCTTRPCRNGGTCQPDPDEYKYTCVCAEDWEGANCDYRKDPCRLQPCLNGGTCKSGLFNIDYSCSCPYPHTGKVCDATVSTTSTSFTTTITTAATTSTTPTTTTTTGIPSTTTPTTNLTMETSSELNLSGAENTTASAPPTTTTTSTTQETTVVEGNPQGQQMEQKEKDSSGFQPLYLLFCLLFIIPLIFVVLYLLIRRRRRKEPETRVDNQTTVVVFNGESLSFENNLYNDVNRSNQEAERRRQGLPDLPSTPTEDDLFNPVKPTFCIAEDMDEVEGAVGGQQTDVDGYVKPMKPAEMEASKKLQSEDLVSRPEGSQRATNNPYADFRSLKEMSEKQLCETSEPTTVEDCEEVHYHDLDELQMSMRDREDDMDFPVGTLSFDMLLDTDTDAVVASPGDEEKSSTNHYSSPYAQPNTDLVDPHASLSLPHSENPSANDALEAPAQGASHYDNPRLSFSHEYDSPRSALASAIPPIPNKDHKADTTYNNVIPNEDDSREDLPIAPTPPSAAVVDNGAAAAAAAVVAQRNGPASVESQDDEDSSGDEQEDIAQLKRSVKEMGKASAENPGFSLA